MGKIKINAGLIKSIGSSKSKAFVYPLTVKQINKALSIFSGLGFQYALRNNSREVSVNREDTLHN
jgi:hypothetical protein